MIDRTGTGAAAAAPQQQPTPARQLGRLSLSGQIAVSLLWFALFANWLTVVPVVIPDQVAAILGPDTAAKEGISGTILGIGALMALIMAPLAGALSDRVHNAKGRRRAFLISGMVGSCIGLALLVPAGAGGNILIYALAIVNLQFWWNWACGPYAGLIPDVVPLGDQARASAWMNIMSILGTFTGNGIAVLLYVHGRPAAAIAALVAVNLVCLGLTLAGVREPPATGIARRFELGPFLRSFWLSPGLHRNFYRVLVTRLFANLGVWSVLTFLLFYLRDVIGVAEPDKVLPMLLGARRAAGDPGEPDCRPACRTLGHRCGRQGHQLDDGRGGRGLCADRVSSGHRPDRAGVSRLFRRLGCVSGNRLGVGAEGAAAQRNRRQGHGHLARRPGAAADPGSRRDRLDHHRRQARGIGALCLCAGLRDRRAVVQPVGALGRAGKAAAPGLTAGRGRGNFSGAQACLNK